LERKIRIGLVGCGVVGTGILELLRDNARHIEGRLGAHIEVCHVVVGDRDKPRADVVPRELLTTDPQVVLDDPDVDIVVEVMGGTGAAATVVRSALERGKHVVTANKALLAEQGDELLQMAEEKKVDLYYEAAVAGGIPVIRVLREAFSSDRILSVLGIINGTSNYILSRMSEEGIDFAVALEAAQKAGYAEADPTLDVSGGDACHKLAILTTLAFGARVHPDQIPTEGITAVGAIDMEFAAIFGYVIKPLALARRTESGALDLRVHPTLIPRKSPLASISGATNAVLIEGEKVGPSLLSGLGAGAYPTAMSVVSDIVDVGRNLLVGAHGRVPSRAYRVQSLKDFAVQDIGNVECRYYLRFSVRDETGVLARIAGVLGAHDISIEQMIQRDGSVDDTLADLVMLTHHAFERDMRRALAEIDALDCVTAPTRALRIDD